MDMKPKQSNMKTMTPINNLLLVGNLQVLALPLVSLYINEEDSTLRIFFRINEVGDEEKTFLVAHVSPENVSRYMNRNIKLQALFPKEQCEEVHINKDGNICIDRQLKTLNSKLKKAGWFEPDFCDDRIRLKCFLNSLNNKK